MFGKTFSTSSAIRPASFFELPSILSYSTPTNCKILSRPFWIGDTFSLYAMLDVSVSDENVPAAALAAPITVPSIFPPPISTLLELKAVTVRSPVLG